MDQKGPSTERKDPEKKPSDSEFLRIARNTGRVQQARSTFIRCQAKYTSGSSIASAFRKILKTI